MLSLSVLTAQGLAQCSKNIDISESSSGNVIATKPTKDKFDCDINLDSFKEVKVNDSLVTLLPSSTNKDYRYLDSRVRQR